MKNKENIRLDAFYNCKTCNGMVSNLIVLSIGSDTGNINQTLLAVDRNKNGSFKIMDRFSNQRNIEDCFTVKQCGGYGDVVSEVGSKSSYSFKGNRK